MVMPPTREHNVHELSEQPFNQQKYDELQELSLNSNIFSIIIYFDKGNDGWKKVVVCIISDGRNNINGHVLEYFTVLGVYHNNIAKAKVNNKVMEAHIYEYTTLISIKHSKNSVETKKNEEIVPTQNLLCLTEQSKKTIDSSQWFFNTFCIDSIDFYVIFIKSYESLYGLWNSFSVDPDVAGVCGNIDIKDEIYSNC
ncbi:5198_t:CDS:2 [Gigaspora margarita]|uniref:Chitin synthase n=1 Tax=Gigaspora margarita TaxID=4874 RepID=A0ABN7UYL8_GIGMA|nr:5198_t:CDS:2 [Gigaspora margarita]